MPFPLGERRHVYMYVYVREKEGWRVYNWIQTGFGADRRWGSGSMMHDEGGLDGKGKKGMKNRGHVCCVVCVSSRDIYWGWPEGKGGVFFTRVLHTVWLAGCPIRVEMSGLRGVGICTKGEKRLCVRKKRLEQNESAADEKFIGYVWYASCRENASFFPWFHTSHILDYPTLPCTTLHYQKPHDIISRFNWLSFVDVRTVYICYVMLLGGPDSNLMWFGFDVS